jgi:acyl carrier protein
MTRDEIRERVVHLLTEIAPEVDPASVEAAVELRDQFDLDSMDWLSFIIAVDEEFKVGIPEADYQQLISIDAFVEYIAVRLGVPV